MLYPDLEKLLEMWEKDCTPLDPSNIEYLISTHQQIYSKYLTIHANVNKKIRRLKYEQRMLYNELLEYYSDKSNLDKGHNPNLKITKAELPKFIERDLKYIEHQKEIDIVEVLFDCITDIISNIQYTRFKNMQTYFSCYQYFNP